MGTVDQYKRQTAVIVDIGTIISGTYVQNEKDVNHILVGTRKIGRVNIMASVTMVEGAEANIDDGTGSILLRSFDGALTCSVGDIVNVIGRPREFNGEKYVIPEIVKHVSNSEWLVLRKNELANAPKVEVVVPGKVEVPQESVANVSQYDKVTASIRKHDAGEGADIGEVLVEADVGEDAVRSLLEQGEIFEVKPGRLKVLE